MVKLREIIQRHKSAASSPPQHLVLNVRRDRILVPASSSFADDCLLRSHMQEDTLWHFLKFPLNDARQLRQKPFQIKFVGEEGIDQGGLTREVRRTVTAAQHSSNANLMFVPQFYTVLTHGFVDPSPAMFTHSAVDDYTYQVRPSQTRNHARSLLNVEHADQRAEWGQSRAPGLF